LAADKRFSALCYSNGTNGDCVEVAFAADVAVRDSKDPAAGMLTVSPSAWEHFPAAPPLG
jgi:hypothetical protein